MQTTGLVRRVLGDVVGLAALATLIALLTYILPGGGTPYQLRNTFLVFCGVLAIPGYVCWIQAEKKEQRPRWLWQALISVGVGAASFILDTLVGLALHPSLPILHTATSTGIMFGITALICPGYTLIALSGWVRGLILHHASPGIRAH
jgi:hypothetical protein